MNSENCILDQKKLLNIIKRMAFEIYERNYEEEEIVLAGVWDEGYTLAGRLKKELEQVCPLQVSLLKISTDKKAKKQPEIESDSDFGQLKNKPVIIVDDVLNTGKTLAYAMKPFLSIPIKKLQSAVLINRDHRSYPVSPDYIGYALSTTVKEHVTVNLDAQKEIGVWLN